MKDAVRERTHPSRTGVGTDQGPRARSRRSWGPRCGSARPALSTAGAGLKPGGGFPEARGGTRGGPRPAPPRAGAEPEPRRSPAGARPQPQPEPAPAKPERQTPRTGGAGARAGEGKAPGLARRPLVALVESR